MSTAADVVELLLEASESDRRAILTGAAPSTLGAVMAEVRRQSDALDEMPNTSRVMPWRESDRESDGTAPRNSAPLSAVSPGHASAEG